jgi:glutamate formiminotransferase/glutamate formiminotransferase/formiminotetrahydrofolate cyclodeaminase
VTLVAVPNFSEGNDPGTIDAIASALDAGGARLLDVHSDPDHNRSVYTLAGEPGTLAAAIGRGARAARTLIDIGSHRGEHPHVGALDVAPIVYLDDADRGAACAEALVLGDVLGDQVELPVLLYGALAGGRRRSELRRGGAGALSERIAAGELWPDFGPRQVDPAVGVTLVAARPPLIAFNAQLSPPATVQDARAIAAAIRESAPEGLPGVRALGLWLEHRGLAQVSMNLEDYRQAGPADVVRAIARHAAIADCELVGLAPRAAFTDFPAALTVHNLRALEDLV